ncbi:hypothetical protein [Nocardia sp. NPDC057353]|uniref:hypothetical protein n=1 Tax=Nocardia sp. NPDC057353 TaxID=3346104 RepID=UPI0036270BA2
MTSRGQVRVWHVDDGWGAIDSPATPGGCWASFSAVRTRRLHFEASEAVEFEWELADQDGYRFRATRAWPAGAQPTNEPGSRSPADERHFRGTFWDIDPDGTIHREDGR